jgi:hypothetical protein
VRIRRGHGWSAIDGHDNREWTGEQRRRFAAALLAAYPSREDLRRMVDYRLDRRLDHYVGNVGMREAVDRLMTDAAAEGWRGDLVDAALADRPGNPELRGWADAYPWASAAAEPAATPVLQLIDTAFFDLDLVRRQINDARDAAGSKLLGLGVDYPESVFINKLCEWLPRCLGEVQRKDWLHLRPDRSSVDERIRHISSYLEELASSNVVCPVLVDGVPTEFVGAFWDGVRAHCGEPDCWFVFIFSGALHGGYPPGIVELDRPRFNLGDLRIWAQDVVAWRKWPVTMAEAWCQLIVEHAGDPHSLDVRLVYEAMDRSIRDARLNPVGFRRMLEGRG